MLKLCLKSILYKKTRNLLIILSIAIGVFSTLIIGIIGENGVLIINNELDNLGIRGYSVSALKEQNNSKKLDNNDFDKISKEEFIESATPLITTTGFLKSDIVPSAIVCGIDQMAKNIISLKTVSGDFFTKKDITNKNKFCYIDIKTNELLFKGKGINKNLELFINGTTHSFKIKCIVESDSMILRSGLNDLLPTMIFIPYTCLQEIIGDNSIDQIALNMSNNTSYNTEEINNLISKTINGEKKLSVQDLNKQRDSLNSILNIVVLVLKIIGGISLLVSGLSITTVMLMRINERKREIGIKKAIGAKNINIIFEFILESFILSVVGLISGITILFIIYFILKNIFEMNLLLNLNLFLNISLITIISGSLFGIYPAIKASKLKPIDALRDE